MQSIKTIFFLAIFVGLIWLGFKGIFWLGHKWNGFIDSTQENELLFISDLHEIPKNTIEIQWYADSKTEWLTKNGEFMGDIPNKEGKNSFRIFINNQLAHTFYLIKESATHKHEFKLHIRDKGDEVCLYFGWDLQFYHDDAVGIINHQMKYFEKENFLKQYGM
ncbi:MAG: hypothetical protein KDC92_05835 [Bacteroidetes bacterium]|nr:hypothetical protein [Bacteroidota bacterium]